MRTRTIISVFGAALLSIAAFRVIQDDNAEAEVNLSVPRASAPPPRSLPTSEASPVSPQKISVNTASGGKVEDEPREEIFRLLKDGTPASLLKAHKVVWGCKLEETLKRQLVVFPEGFPKERDTRLKDCAQLPAEYRRDYISWLQRAVDARVPGASVQYLSAGPNGEIDDLELRPDDPLISDWRKRTVDYLMRDAKQGDVHAMATLTLVYGRQGIAATHDPTLEAGMELALVQLQDKKSMRVSERSRRYAADKLNALDPASRQKAIQIAREMVDTEE